MNAIKKLPGMGHGSGIRVIAVLSVYALILLCVAGAIVGTLTATDEPDNDVAVAEPPTPDPTPDASPTPEPEKPTIAEDHIDATVSFMDDEPQVRDTTISVEDDTVIIAVIVDPSVDDERAREILDSATRWLSSRVADSYDTVESPSADSLGDIWNYYSLQVGAGPDPDTFYARGAMHQDGGQISWD